MPEINYRWERALTEKTAEGYYTYTINSPDEILTNEFTAKAAIDTLATLPPDCWAELVVDEYNTIWPLTLEELKFLADLNR